MKRLLILLVVTISTPSVFANGARSLVLFSGMMAGTGAVSDHVYFGMIPNEATDWQDATKSTSVLGKTCGLLIETKLLRGQRHNYMFVGVSNSLSQPVHLMWNKMEFRFGSGKLRIPDISTEKNMQELKSGWYVWGLVPFPKKQDFKNETSVALRLPIVQSNASTPCVMESHHVRDKNQPAEEATYTEYSSLHFVFEMGASVLSTSLLRAAHVDPGSELSGGVRMEGFGSANHGAFWSLMFSGLGNPRLEKYPIGTDPNTKASVMNFAYGYTYRNSFLSSDHSYYISLAPAYSFLSARKIGENESENYGYFSIFNSFSYDYRIATSSGYPEVDHALGITLMTNYFPKQSSKSLSVEGLQASLLLRYRWGF